MTRVAVFIDYQNVYHGAWEVEGDPFVIPGGLKSGTHLRGYMERRDGF